MNVVQKAHARGASKSLKKTITEIMDFMNDEETPPNDKLRPFLHDKLGDLSERWFRKGFNCGHRQSYSEFKTDGEVPVKLEFGCSRRLSPNQHRALELKSKIKKKAR